MHDVGERKRNMVVSETFTETTYKGWRTTQIKEIYKTMVL